MLPRQRIASAGYAFRSGISNFAEQASTAAYAERAHSVDNTTVINVTTITATTINVTTLTVSNIIASEVITKDLAIDQGLKIGHTILIGAGAFGGVADNHIAFSGAGGVGGIIETIAPAPGPLTLQTAGGHDINLDPAGAINLTPGGPGLINVDGKIELLANQRLVRSVGGPLRLDGANDLRINSGVAGQIYTVEGGGNVGVGVLTPAIPAERLHVIGNTRAESAAPSFIWRENDQVLPAGLWRTRLEGDNLLFERNTAAPGDFSTVDTPIVVTAGGSMGIGIVTPASRLAIRGAGATAATSGLHVANSAGQSALFVRMMGR